jgi:hypothetical protein
VGLRVAGEYEKGRPCLEQDAHANQVSQGEQKQGMSRNIKIES